MGFSKYTKSEKTEILTPTEHQQVEDELRRLGKTSAQSLTDEERKALGEKLDS